MHRLAEKTRRKKQVTENASFFRHRQPRGYWFIARYLLLRTKLSRSTSRTLLVTLEWIEFGCVHKLYPVESDFAAILDNDLF